MPIDAARASSTRVRHARRVLPLLAGLALALLTAIGPAACSGLPGGTPPLATVTATATPAPVATAEPTATPPPPTPTPTPTPAATPVPATPTPEPGEAVALLVSDPAERARLEAALAPAAGFNATGDASARWAIADEPLSGSRPIVLARWAAITDQRRDVLDLSLTDVQRILRGDVRGWSRLGGSRQPISAYLPASQAPLIAGALGIPIADLAAELLPDAKVADVVANTPGAFALIEPEQLRLGVLALTVDGHDPYRDPARESPLSAVRWIRAPRLGTPCGSPPPPASRPRRRSTRRGCWSPAS